MFGSNKNVPIGVSLYAVKLKIMFCLSRFSSTILNNFSVYFIVVESDKVTDELKMFRFKYLHHASVLEMVNLTQ